MAKFSIRISEKYECHTYVEVEAQTEEEALELAGLRYSEEDPEYVPIFDDVRYLDTDFVMIGEEAE